MLRFANTEERFCEVAGEYRLVEVVHRDTSTRGLGGMLDPRRISMFEVNCPCEEACREKGCDCMWALGGPSQPERPAGLEAASRGAPLSAWL